MIGMEQLDRMSGVALADAASEGLAELSDAVLEGTTAAERLESLLSRTPNPYCYRVGKMPVRVAFAPDARPLEEVLKAHFIALKQAAFAAERSP